MLFRLEINNGNNSSSSFSSYALHPNVPTIVGRDPSIAHVPLENENSVSRKHAILTVVYGVSSAGVDAKSAKSGEEGEEGDNGGGGVSGRGDATFLEVVDCGSKLGTRVSTVVSTSREEGDEEEKNTKLEKLESGTTRRVPLILTPSSSSAGGGRGGGGDRGGKKVWLLKFGKIAATVRCIEEDNAATNTNGLDAADENEEEEGEATESDDDDDDDDDDGSDGGVNEEENGDEGVGWKRAKTKKEKKKTDGNNRGRVNVDREEVEVETVVDASLFREQILSPLNSSPPPSRLVSTIEEEENDENRLRRVDDVLRAKERNNSSNDNNTTNKKRFQKQSITINGKPTKAARNGGGVESFSPSAIKVKNKKQKVPWPYETDGYETLAQFETALDREEKAARRLKEKMAEDLFEDFSTTKPNLLSVKSKGSKASRGTRS